MYASTTIPSFRRQLLPLLGLAALSTSSIAQTFMISEGGAEIPFEVDCTSLYCQPANGKAHAVTVNDFGTLKKVSAEAQRLEQQSDATFNIRLFQKGRPQTNKNARSLRRKILVEFEPGTELEALTEAAGAQAFKQPHYTNTHVILTFQNQGDSLTKLAAVRALEGVVSADPLMAKKRFKKLIPNDPRFAWSSSNQQYQWHLRNTGQNSSIVGHDVNITNVWDTITGDGVTISIVDDGVEVTHPDLVANVNTAIDFNWNSGDPNDPSPTAGDNHGTPCAGVAAAKGNNGSGVSGAAPDASIVGLRLIAGNTTDQEDSEALSHRLDVIDISSNSWGPNDDALKYPIDSLVQDAFARGVDEGRGGLGTIYVWAGGNGRVVQDYSNYDGFNNQIETISVGAISFDGRQSEYSESGANLLVCAPSDDGNTDPGITTTAIISEGSYTNDFGGTSSATPLVSGCIALILEQNPNLGWRDVQEILIRSAEKVDATDSDWATNSAGFHFNHKYGAGMIDAAASTALASSWANLGPQDSNVASASNLNIAIPDDSNAGVNRNLTISGTNLRVEHVQLTVDITHTYVGDLVITLTSPEGTVSRFSEVHAFDENETSAADWANYSDFIFKSVRNWGESSNGTWTVNVSDQAGQEVGTINSLSLQVFGSEPIGNYAAWAAANIPNGQSTSETADNDGDGRNNLLEYALSSNPTSADTTVNCPTFSGSAFSFAADTSKTDLTYTAQRSSNLSSWSPVTSTLVGTSGNIQTRQVSNTSGTRWFYRLLVTKP